MHSSTQEPLGAELKLRQIRGEVLSRAEFVDPQLLIKELENVRFLQLFDHCRIWGRPRHVRKPADVLFGKTKDETCRREAHLLVDDGIYLAHQMSRKWKFLTHEPSSFELKSVYHT